MQQVQDYTIENSPGLSEKKYKTSGILIILFALLIRLFDLGERVFHHDESVHASFTLRLLEAGEYRYNPAYHGPFLFHSTAAVFHFLGINDTTARLIPVFFGVATILLVFLLKKELGKRGVLWTAFLLAFSPSMVYFSRFFRNDLIIVFCTLAAVIGVIRYHENLHSPKRYPYLILAASSLALAVSSKENAYLIILMFGAYAGFYSLYRLYSSWKRERLSLKKTLSLKVAAISPFLPEVLLSGLLFIFIVMLFYTSFFRFQETPFSIVERAFSHWMAMHRTERIGGPFYFYIPILLVYESPVLIFGTAGIVHFLRKKGKNFSFFLFVSYWAIASLLLYSYLQEKVPWLVVHIILPFGILAGAYLGNFLSRSSGREQENSPGAGDVSFETERKSVSGMRRSSTHTLVTGILALTLIISLAQCISINFYRSMEHDELMTYSQSPQDIRELMEKIDGFDHDSENLRIAVVDPENLYWPLPWYFRDYEKAEYYISPPGNEKYDAIIVPAAYRMYNAIPEERYASYNFSLRPGKKLTLYYDKTLEKGE
ncbi:TIGR03663 family protein [Methanosarcina sp. MSH10X1]|uniref:flippase activity-associated protein Agl23 n=1 Tax=Methanosarcina sp. MSH10X1 TaxID=2507075 RepID=UPI000FFB407B|nr:flippase activity-associated protein Agl23 [Methanosarcina sp. MSH10X1]RXA16821.1 TIGR03663 family protein [Methanosarcina sp. MSH10X1]